MYLCFEIDDKRAAFPESSLVNFDENGFTVRSMIGTRQGKDMAFLNIDSFKGAMPTFEQAVKWVKRMPSKGAAKQQRPPQQQGGAKLPESPSF
ncbi:MAG: hypothetical protein QNK37_31755 [Acidobacteriota bacterium]|nr:hypothetical protein [Acidobacteriota bacterium]